MALPPLAELKADADAWALGAFDAASALAQRNQSRELSLAITKLEEAQMWLEKVTLPEAT